MKKLVFTIILAAIISFPSVSQPSPEQVVKSIFDEALTSNEAYENLRFLCKNTAGRIAGTSEAAAAVEFTRQVMEEMDLSHVFLQKVTVPHWERGTVEFGMIVSSRFGSLEVPVSALGASPGTGKDGVISQVVEVKSIGELETLGIESIKGKIVFFNRPMDPTVGNTFSAYGGAAAQRTAGPAAAAKFGAKGVVIRSLTLAHDDVPHTGVTRYSENGPYIPAVSISTNGADTLSRWLETDTELKFHFITNCKNYPETESANVVGEIKGTVFPDEIITIGGHLDAWGPGEGAHDDGGGCIQSIEVLRLFKVLGIKPKRTIRAVMFMDEEMAQSGAIEYARWAEEHNEKHYAALESDRGVLSPVGFGFSAEGERLENLYELKKHFEPYGIYWFKQGGGGADIGQLRRFGTLLISYIPDTQRYFNYHHSANDSFETVNHRELQLGSAAIASLIYLIDLYDL